MGQNESKSSAKSMGFIIVSSLVHIGLATAVVSMNMDSKKIDATEMEIMAGISTDATEVEIAGGGVAAPTPAAEPLLEATTQEVGVAELPAQKNEPVKVLPVAATKVKVAAAPMMMAEASEETPIQTTDAALTNEAEQLDNTSAAAALAAPPAELQDDVIAEDLDKVDQEHQAKLAEVEADKKLKEEAAKTTAAAIAAEEIKKQEDEKAQNLVAAQADKESQEAKAAKDAADAAASAKLAEQAAKLAAAQEAQAAKAASEAAGAGSAAVTEIPKDVRSIEELKQKPGNPRPMYSADDRLKGRAGEVAFLAYVSKEGAPMQFKMLQSSGHRELDAKTLKALKNWKFHPGQEGWVEIPFKWDLKGGPQEMPAQLRRAKVSVTN